MSKRPTYATAALAALLLTAPLAARASDKSGAFAVRGIGNETCEAFNKAFKEKQQGLVLYESWLDGYLTSINTWSKDLYDVAPWQRGPMLLFLTANFCENQPQGRLFEAATAIRNFLKPFQLAQNSPAVDVKVGDRSVRLYQDTLRRAQELLIKAGHLQGKPDGAWGAKTQAAFEAYQEKSGLKKTGVPDQETLFKLFVEAHQQAAQVQGTGGTPAAPRTAQTAGQKSQPQSPARQAPPQAANGSGSQGQRLDLNLGGAPR